MQYLVCGLVGSVVDLLFGEPGPLDAVDGDHETGAEDDGAGGDERPEVFPHQPGEDDGEDSSDDGHDRNEAGDVDKEINKDIDDLNYQKNKG